uniref:Uncharacterized protein n=1 Tax=Arundo donax TaxID=35708 RepID=A0A0A8XZ52_ARUDO
MKGRRHIQLNSSKPKEFPPKVAGKDGVAITHNGSRHPMETNNFTEEYPSHRISCIWMG